MKQSLFIFFILFLIYPSTIKADNWEVSEDGVLTISGNGKLLCDLPLHLAWKEGKIKKIIIEEGITSMYDDIGFFADPKNEDMLQEVVLPKSLESIGGPAFFGNRGLKKINLENVKYIDDLAFCRTGIIEADLSSIIDLGHNAFSECRDLEKVKFSNKIKKIKYSTFDGCFRLTEINIPSSVKEIGGCAFRGHSCYSLSIPWTVNKIYDGAFSKNYKTNYDGTILSLPPNINTSNCKEIGLTESSVQRYLNRKSKREMSDNNGNLLFYRVIESGYGEGILDAKGSIIIPSNLGYSNFKILQKGLQVFLIGSNQNNNTQCIFSSKGQQIMATDFDAIEVFEDSLFKVKANAHYGILSADFHEIIPLNKGYTSINSVGNANNKYYIVSKDGQYGLIDVNGNVIVPTEMNALEVAGAGFLRYKVASYWGIMNYNAKVIIPTSRGYTWIGNYVSTTKRFPFEMDGYKGECNKLGQQVSKRRVAKPKTSSPVASSSISNYNDCITFDLKGNVKSCSVSMIGYSDVLYVLSGKISSLSGTIVGKYSFAKNGKYIPNEGEKVIYDGKVLKKIIKGSNETEFEYRNGRLHRKKINEETFGVDFISLYEYTYNEKGMIETQDGETLSMTGSSKSVVYYSDYKLDSHGNWISRKSKTKDGTPVGEVRHITYY